MPAQATIAKLIAECGLEAPAWMPTSLAFEVLAGSESYGCALPGGSSDCDIVGVAVPPQDIEFPHLMGHVAGFGPQPAPFHQWQKHHIEAPDGQYDLSVYGIRKFCALAAENNPNILDVLFAPEHCLLHSTPAGDLLRASRREFLHQGAFHKHSGYAKSTERKMLRETAPTNPKRAESVRQHGYDTKYAMHLMRLHLQCRQILEEGDLQVDRNGEMLRSIRAGQYRMAELLDMSEELHQGNQALLAATDLPSKPDWLKLRGLLLQCYDAAYEQGP